MQSETGFPSSHQLKSDVASKSSPKLAARAVPSADAGLLLTYTHTCTHAHIRPRWEDPEFAPSLQSTVLWCGL